MNKQQETHQHTLVLHVRNEGERTKALLADCDSPAMRALLLLKCWVIGEVEEPE